MTEVEKRKKNKKKTDAAKVEAAGEEVTATVSSLVLNAIGVAGLFDEEPVAGQSAPLKEESTVSEDQELMAHEETQNENQDDLAFADAVEATEPAADEEMFSLESEDASEESQEFISFEQLVSIVESLLFASDKPVSISTIKQVVKGSNIRSKDIQKALDHLASEYAHPLRGVSIEEINGGYQLRTKADNSDYLRRLVKGRPFKLSGPALEVLSIIAYKQPLIKSEVDEIRGVESGHLVRALLEKGLVAFGGKSELPGKPMQYITTRKFLEIFGLRNIKELPSLAEIDQLLPEGITDEEEAKPVLADLTDEMSEGLRSSYSEGEEELGKITDQLSSIDTSSEFFEQEKIRQRERRDRERAQDIRDALAVGEAVDPRDVKWLERYEDKLNMIAASESQAAAVQELVHDASASGLTEPDVVNETDEALLQADQLESMGLDEEFLESEDQDSESLAADIEDVEETNS